jgi:AraC family transcriptional regulator of adaptative response/methylated-DNA-[protein]-cysteine methyltransferase
MRANTQIAVDDQRWRAVLERDTQTLPFFVYAVITTGVYCLVDCPSRRPLAKNVAFFSSCAEAEGAGFRACKRCRPNDVSPRADVVKAVEASCEAIRTAEVEPSLEQLAKASGMSAFHFQRTFKSVTGVTPKAFARAHRMEQVRQNLGSDQSTVTAAIYDAGFNSSSRFYENATRALGMTPSTYRNGGAGVRILFAVGECTLGSVLVACSKVGVCAILLGDDPEPLLEDLQARFPNADLVGGDEAFETLVAMVVGFVDAPNNGLGLPLDIRGTAFQERVWQALRDIPAGETASYRDIAEKIGSPTSHRAVAQACGANNLAVAIPCHRVVRSDGGLSGYRWGIDRKKQLLEMEMAG